MPAPDEPTKFPRGACPKCGSKNLRRIREGENETVIVPRRACRDCGTVFSPAVSPLLALVTAPLALLILAFAVWAVAFNERGDQETLTAVAWVAFLFVVTLAFATVQILRQGEPKIHSTPPKEREAKPWDKPPGGE